MRTVLQSHQHKVTPLGSRNLESLDERCDTRKIKIRDTCKVDHDLIEGSIVQYSKKLIAKMGRRFNRDFTRKTEQHSGASLLHLQIKLADLSRFTSWQRFPPMHVRLK